MKIHLDELEIHEALKMYVESQGFSLKDREVEIDMTAGRNPTRISADISINKLGSPAAHAEPEATVAEDTDSNLFGDDD